VIERKMLGREWPRDGEEGWAWNELGLISRERGGAPRAHIDALKLLAVFLQHTDSKPQQQRIVCVGQPAGTEGCGRPFLMINDAGLTFGRANRSNANEVGSTNLAAWRTVPVWKDARGCTGHLPRSLTGSLANPAIGEEGRSFLAGLLTRLSDRQLQELFDTARVTLRLRNPEDVRSGFATIAEWVDAFKQKRSQIVDRKCA
jgi:hypothetical protein